jgi:hypothetical protein
LSYIGTTAIKRKPGRPSKTATIVVPVAQKPKKRKKMSAEGRERFRQAQIKRWAEVKLLAKSSAKSGAAQPSKRKRKASRISTNLRARSVL